MKSILPEWYGHDDETLEQIVKTGTISLDANVMLDLYRVGSDQREQILEAIRGVQDRLFIPYQAAFEFQKNRLKVAADSEKHFKDLASGLEITESQLNQIRDPKVRASVEELSTKAQKGLAKALDALRSEHFISFEEVRIDDPVRRALDEIIGASSIGKKPPDATLAERRKFAQKGIDDRTPPGFADVKGKDDPLGDYLLWAELLDHMRGATQPLLHVTNDAKEDWWHIQSGHTIGPLPGLLAEMYDASAAHPYHQVKLGSFLALAKEYLAATVDDSTIEAVESINKPARIIDSQAMAQMYPDLAPSALETARKTIVSALESYRKTNPEFWADLNTEIKRQNYRIATSILLDPDFQDRIEQARRKELAAFSTVLGSFSSVLQQADSGTEADLSAGQDEPEPEDAPGGSLNSGEANESDEAAAPPESAPAKKSAAKKTATNDASQNTQPRNAQKRNR
jgi:hypothetical protein